MKLLRKIILFASGALALVNLVGVLLHLVTFHWGAIPMALLRLAGWTAVCVFMIRLERGGAASAPKGP